MGAVLYLVADAGTFPFIIPYPVIRPRQLAPQRAGGMWEVCSVTGRLTDIDPLLRVIILLAQLLLPRLGLTSRENKTNMLFSPALPIPMKNHEKTLTNRGRLSDKCNDVQGESTKQRHQ
eukprot:1146367-Pelagomonas_calceolata.AAC.4